jgi:tetratricopeptide (TPR) repeat protein
VGAAAIPVILVILLIAISWRVVIGFNKDLVRARAWNELFRRSLPFLALSVMALTIFPVQTAEQEWVLMAWAGGSAVLVILANLFSIPLPERRATRAFRQGNYAEAAEQYRKLADEKPLARHYAFLGAALGANERYEEALEASGTAVEKDPQYGIAYYNRALIQHRQNRKARAKKDLKRALEADLPRRFRKAAKNLLEDLSG